MFVKLSGYKGLVPLAASSVQVMGCQREILYTLPEYEHEMDLRRGLQQAIREEYRALATQAPSAWEDIMKEAKYFTMSALVEAHPVLKHLATGDAELEIGKWYATIGTVNKPVYLVKVGEAVSNDGSGWKRGIYRLAPELLPHEKTEEVS